MKLSRPGAATAQADNSNQNQGGESTKAAPKGWGQKAGGEGGQADNSQQREAIQERINPEANRSAFSRQVQDDARQISTGGERVDPAQGGEGADPAPRTTRTRKPREDQSQAADTNAEAFKVMLSELAAKAGTHYLRMEAVKAATAFKDSFEQTEDMFALADEILAYVTKENS